MLDISALGRELITSVPNKFSAPNKLARLRNLTGHSLVTTDFLYKHHQSRNLHNFSRQHAFPPCLPLLSHDLRLCLADALPNPRHRHPHLDRVLSSSAQHRHRLFPPLQLIPLAIRPLRRLPLSMHRNQASVLVLHCGNTINFADRIRAQGPRRQRCRPQR